MPKLCIAIDPGFDSMKVVANGQVFKFPFNVVETDERNMSDYGLRDDFLLYKSKTGTTYRVGQKARELIFENKSADDADTEMQNFYTEQRFISEEFSVGLNTAIAIAIEKTGFYSVQADLDIYLIVALPHACRTKYSSTITGAAAGERFFALTMGSGVEKEYHFSVTEDHVYTVSQTIAAILGETSDNDGNINQEKFYYLSEGPTLVLDGGYYTFGLVPVSRGGSVDDAKTESDTSHAMKNVNMAVADEIADKRPDIKHFTIEYLLSQQNGLIRYMSNGHAGILDLHRIREEKIKELCDSFIQHLNVRYNNLLDIRYVLVTGGTGACYYNQLLDYYKSVGIMDEEHMLLTSSELYDEIHPIEYAIAIGAYKGLQGKIQAGR